MLFFFFFNLKYDFYSFNETILFLVGYLTIQSLDTILPGIRNIKTDILAIVLLLDKRIKRLAHLIGLFAYFNIYFVSF